MRNKRIRIKIWVKYFLQLVIPLTKPFEKQRRLFIASVQKCQALQGPRTVSDCKVRFTKYASSERMKFWLDSYVKVGSINKWLVPLLCFPNRGSKAIMTTMLQKSKDSVLISFKESLLQKAKKRHIAFQKIWCKVNKLY